jgi:polyhydroxyalkanoate synthase
MYCWYVRNTYLENNLRIPIKTTQCESPVDLMLIDVPTYVLACREDHIVPWRTAYATTRLVSGEVRFTLAASGHIAGVINPASRNRRNYWINGELGERPERWLETSCEMPGSWWTDWSAWLRTQDGEQVPARVELGSPEFSQIEPAPGRYVKLCAN